MKKLIALVAALVMVSSFAYAADWNFYGNARVATFVTDVDNPGATQDDKDFDQDLFSTSRFGANIKVSDELSGRVEFSVDNSNVGTRLLYGTWNFGSGEFSVGNMWTPLNWFMSNQAYGGDNGMAGWGAINAHRDAALQLKFGGFAIALVQTYEDACDSGVTSFDRDIPRIEADYVLNFDSGFVKVAAGYNTYTIEAATYDADIDSWVVALNGGMNFGPAYVKGGVWSGQNVGCYQALGSLLIANTTYTATGIGDDGEASVSSAGVVTDNDAYGMLIVVGGKINDMFAVEAGYGYAQNELDMTGSQTDDVSGWYVQAPITMAPGVFLVPEIGSTDYGEDAAGLQEEEVFYYGAKWQINF